MKKKVIVGISGASGASLAIHCLDILKQAKDYWIRIEWETQENAFIGLYFLRLSQAFFILKDNQ